jgi:hypothetical protein
MIAKLVFYINQGLAYFSVGESPIFPYPSRRVRRLNGLWGALNTTTSRIDTHSNPEIFLDGKVDDFV